MRKKRILITGKNSYVGNSFEKWIEEKYSGKYEVEKISLREEGWKERDFSDFDVVYHVAGLAHIKETKKNAHLYYKINRDLTFEVAKKAKREGVKQFIFLSSMSVYGLETGIINNETNPTPKSNYGKSKLEAEKLIESLRDGKFKVVILRPPLIYGKDCKGNYKRLAKLAVKTPIFPKVDNVRSMIFIDNLSQFVKYVIDYNCSGTFCPQNKEYVNTCEMVKLIAEINRKKIWFTKIFNPIIIILRKNKNVNKVFGNLVYDRSIYEIKEIEQISFVDSIRLTER